MISAPSGYRHRAARVAAVPSYADFVPTRRFGRALAIAPDGSAIAYIADEGGQLNLLLQPLDGSPPTTLTRGTDWSVRQVGWSQDSTTLFYAADRDGDEYYQLFRVGRDGSEPQQLTDSPKAQHYLADAPVSPDGRWLAYAANDRDPTDQDVLLRDLATGQVRRLLDVGGMLFAGSWSPDSSRLTVFDARSNTDVAPLVAGLDGSVQRLLEGRPGKHLGGSWAADGDAVYLTTDLDRDFVAFTRLDLADGRLPPVDRPDWDVAGAVVVAGGRVAIWLVNVDGISHLRARNLVDGSHLPVPAIPPGAMSTFSASDDGSHVAVLAATGTRPLNVGLVDLSAGRFDWITDSSPTAADASTFIEPELVRFPTHDGRDIAGYLYRPAGDGPFGVVLSIHGGPEFQELPEYNYNGLYQYLLSRGVGIFAPNVRGSTGYGTSFQKLIHHDWGGDELKDFEQAHHYLTGLDWVDPSRIGVFGGSFGGFATLSCVSRLPDLWAGAVSIVGPSNLVTLVSSVPPTWRRLMAEWVGDLETEQDFLRERSPITYADDIVTPLFVIQGANDQRVVQAESGQIVERLRARGVDVRYDVYPDEGHGFAKRANESKAMSDAAEFLIGYLRATPDGARHLTANDT
jgi:dipeptidyl aminopeptidase/acylaminoacyl peptidase